MSSLTISPLPKGRVVSTVSYGMPDDAVVSTAPSLATRRFRGGKVGQFFSKIIVSLLVLVIGASGALQASSSGNADANFLTNFLAETFCREEAMWFAPASPTMGLSAFGIGEPVIYKDGTSPDAVANKTAYEKYGVTGARFSMYRGTKPGMSKTETIRGIDRETAKDEVDKDENDPRAQGECIPVMGMVSTGVANSIFLFNGIVTSVAIWVYGSAFNPTWISTLNDQVALVITGDSSGDGLKDVLYFPFLIIIIMFSALYLGWIGLAKRASMQAATSALWMIGAVLTGSLLMFNPKFVPDMANNIVGAVEHAILQGTTGVALGVGTTTSNLCEVNYSSSSASDDAEVLENQRVQVIRQMECSLWATFLYMPWVSGQYGMSVSEVESLTNGDHEYPNGISNFNVQIGENTIENNIAIYQLDKQSSEYGTAAEDNNTKMQNWFNVPDFLAKNHPEKFSTWAGKEDSGTLIGVAFLTWIVSIFGLASVVVLSISMLIYSLGMTMLIFVSVLFLLVGAHPGMGRGIALRWAEMVVGTILKRIMAAAILGILMAFYAIIIKNVLDTSDDSMGYGMSILAIIAISVAALGYRKTITEAFSNVQFGGTQSGMENGPSGGVKRLGAAAGMGALTGVAAIGSGKAIKAGVAAARRPDGSVGKGIGAGVKAAAKATAAGGKRGAISGQMTGYSALDAYRSGSAATEEEIKKHEQAAGEEWKNKNPHDMEKRAREEQEKIEAYREEYEKNKDNEKWRKNFEDYYGMEAPDPEHYDFAGYGMTRDVRTGRFKKNPRLLVTPRRKSQLPPPPPAPNPGGGPGGGPGGPGGGPGGGGPGGGGPDGGGPDGGGPDGGGPGGGPGGGGPSGGGPEMAPVINLDEQRRRRRGGGSGSTRPNQQNQTPPPPEPDEAPTQQNETQPPPSGGGSTRPNQEPAQNQNQNTNNENPQPEQKSDRGKPKGQPVFTIAQYKRKFEEYNQKFENFNKMPKGADDTAQRRMWDRAKKALENEHAELMRLYAQAQADESKQHRGE